MGAASLARIRPWRCNVARCKKDGNQSGQSAMPYSAPKSVRTARTQEQVALKTAACATTRKSIVEATQGEKGPPTMKQRFFETFPGDLDFATSVKRWANVKHKTPWPASPMVYALTAEREGFGKKQAEPPSSVPNDENTRYALHPCMPETRTP